MADLVPLKVASQPGCKRDGTLLEGDNYVDTQWCRFQLRKGLPRKMGGYRRLTAELSGISRGLNVFNSDLDTYTHTGWSGGLERFLLDQNGNVSSISDRTPAGFTVDAKNLWQFDTLAEATGIKSYLLAHAAPNLTDIAATTDAPVYYGDVLGTGALTATTSPDVSGGVMSLGPFAVSFGNYGVVNYTKEINPNDVTGVWESVRPASSKLVYGLPVRAGAGNGPSGLIWGVESLIRMTFVGGTATFNFDNITSAYSLLSSQCIIEYDGIYYWAGIDHFLSFNGVIQEIENGMNLNWFYDNLNYAQSQKVFAFKIPRWGEIWWCYPRGTATECTHAVIYNVRLSRIFGYAIWYDTELPNNGRSAGQFARVFRSPLMTGTEPVVEKATVTLQITTASTSTSNYNIILNGATAVNVTATASGSTITTAAEIAAGTYTDWIASQNGSAVTFISITDGEKSGLYSLAQSGAGTPAVGVFATVISGAPKYKLWQQEFGTDDVDGNYVLAVQSYFETGSLWLATDGEQKNNSIYLDYIEPDFVQSGDMTVQVIGSYSNARAADVSSTPLSFPDTATSAEEQVVYIREQRRQLRLRFESNVTGGDYQQGDTVLQVRPGDARITS
jgi:hypothetical protein